MNVQDLLSSADMIFGQLEGPLAEPSEDPSAPDIPHKPGWRHSGRKVGPALKNGRLRRRVLREQRRLPGRRRGGQREGSRRGRHPALRRGIHARGGPAPAIIVRGPLRIGFLSYTSVFWPSNHAASDTAPGCATIKAYEAYQAGPRAIEMPGGDAITRTFADAKQLDAMRQDVRALREAADIVILSCHWGVSAKIEPVEYQKEIAHAAIEAGADMVFGHHPHEVQGAEIYRGKPIFYSLGNFAFDWDVMRNRHLDGLALRCAIAGNAVTRIEVLPVRRNEHNDICVLGVETPGGQEILGRFETLSRKLGETVALSNRNHLDLAFAQASPAT
ncbi:MAG: CapA family protein [Acetobacteraceae bacterium]